MGKSALAAEIYSYTARLGMNSHLVTEFAKDWAMRKIAISPINQLAVVGQQSHFVTALFKNNYSLAISDTSLLLAAFYANYYSNNSFPNLVSAVQEWEFYLMKNYKVKQYSFFILLTKEEYQNRYKADGRYETFEQCFTMQDKLETWLHEHGNIITIKASECNPEHILKLSDIKL